MAIAAPPILRSVINGYHDAFEALDRMRSLAVTMLAIMTGVSLLWPLSERHPDQWEPGWRSILSSVPYDAIWCFLMTPFAIAIHRYILLGEIAQGYRIYPRSQRFARYFCFLFAISLLLGELVPLALSFELDFGRFGALVQIGLAVGAIIVAIRSILLFPAIAVDAPGARFWNGMKDSRGRFLRILIITTLAVLPATVIGLICFFIVLLWVHSALLTSIIAGLFDVGITAIFVAIASRLYQTLGPSVQGREQVTSG